MQKHAQESSVVTISDLAVSYRDADSWMQVLKNVSFSIRSGEIFGLVGESGCGKSTLAYQLLGFRRPNIRVDGGTVIFNGQDVLKLTRPALDKLRGASIGFVPQNPTTALNPGIRIGKQIEEVLFAHLETPKRSDVEKRVFEVLELVGLPTPGKIAERYPHQLSGGQQQRVTIAMAVACEPQLLILDEPTTGLDVTTQQRIVTLLLDLRRRLSISMLYVTHDLALLSQMADRVGVMYAGEMVELAPCDIIFSRPKHPYTRALISSVPRFDDHEAGARRLRGVLRRRNLPAGCPFQPRCDEATEACATVRPALEQIADNHEVACIRVGQIDSTGHLAAKAADLPPRPSTQEVLLELDKVAISYGSGRNFLTKWLSAGSPPTVPSITFSIRKGEILGLVGESGSGKSTIVKAISGLIKPDAGEIKFEGEAVAGDVGDRSIDLRRKIQFVFQNPDASLNPRKRIGAILRRHIEYFCPDIGTAANDAVLRSLADVRLDKSYAGRFPDQLSGGERQRVAIARALAVNPSLILCDEVLSALDVSVQASIVDLLMQLRAEHQVALLFISHDLTVVRNLADRVGVLYRGQLMEFGSNAAIFSPPYHPYTYTLLSAVPAISKRNKDTSPTATSAGGTDALGPSSETGCAFAARCPWRIDNLCATTPPPMQVTRAGASISCHIRLDELERLTGWKCGKSAE